MQTNKSSERCSNILSSNHHYVAIHRQYSSSNDEDIWLFWKKDIQAKYIFHDFHMSKKKSKSRNKRRNKKVVERYIPCPPFATAL